LNLKYDKPLSNFAFRFNLRRYILDVATGITRDATRPVLGDSSPAWDPAGHFLYFLSSRELQPAYDAGRFGMSFHGRATHGDLNSRPPRFRRPGDECRTLEQVIGILL